MGSNEVTKPSCQPATIHSTAWILVRCLLVGVPVADGPCVESDRMRNVCRTTRSAELYCLHAPVILAIRMDRIFSFALHPWSFRPPANAAVESTTTPAFEPFDGFTAC